VLPWQANDNFNLWPQGNISDYLREHHLQYRQPTMRKLPEKIRALKDAPDLDRPGLG